MADQRLRAILEFLVRGDQKVKQALGDVEEKTKTVANETKELSKSQAVGATGADKMRSALGKMAIAAGAAGAAIYTAKQAFDFAAEGAQLKQLGVQINFAPVIDINNNPANPVINSRSFGENRSIA